MGNTSVIPYAWPKAAFSNWWRGSKGGKCKTQVSECMDLG
jgi:hypothetical protein